MYKYMLKTYNTYDLKAVVRIMYWHFVSYPNRNLVKQLIGSLMLSVALYPNRPSHFSDGTYEHKSRRAIEVLRVFYQKLQRFFLAIYLINGAPSTSLTSKILLIFGRRQFIILIGLCGKEFIYHVHDDVIKWKHFSRYWTFVQAIHRSPVNSPHKGQWRGALMFSLITAWINAWVKQSWGWWFGAPSRSLWRHCNAYLYHQVSRRWR